MKMRMTALNSMAALICCVNLSAMAQDKPGFEKYGAEGPAVRVPLDQYIKAHASGDGEFIRKAFHPTAKIMSVRDGKLNTLTAEEFATRFSGKPAADEAQRRRQIDHRHHWKRGDGHDCPGLSKHHIY